MLETIASLLKAAWVKRPAAPECIMRKSVPFEYPRDVEGKLIFNCNFLLKTLWHLSRLLLFYKDVLNTWQRIVAHTPLSKNEMENEVVWNNKFLQLQKSQTILMTEDGNFMALMFFSIPCH